MVQAGTRMTAAEYATLPETTQPMELIHGEIIVSPAPKDVHQLLITRLMALFIGMLDADERAGLRTAPSDVHLSDDTVVQPDVFWVSAENDHCQLGDDDYWHGPPDLVVEVLSPRTAVHDKTTKFELYQQAGVREYWIVEATYIEVYNLTDGTFERTGVYEAGQTFTSAALSGHEIDVEEIF